LAPSSGRTLCHCVRRHRRRRAMAADRGRIRRHRRHASTYRG
jgi:hypothetical protein